ncbi:hypothetical protein JTE90_015166 [Oedothorax gibbosus]|uniref:Rab-GAP TBC domain-containing protein n=1 Tax=Oedothorax gibbosus TaxID=931172 RepID=A0AAV6V8D3_9ARAC|nr:hypothetical protein JTE90_015166 [Oedothorax gibbosus]
MDSDSDVEDNTTELNVNSIKSDFIDCETFESVSNGNKDACFQDVNDSGNASSFLEEMQNCSESMTDLPSEHGDNLSELPDTDAVDAVNLCEETTNGKPLYATNITLTNGTVLNCVEHSCVEDVNLNDANEALSYFSPIEKDLIRVESGDEVICEDKPLLNDIPNGITQISTKSNKQNLINKKKCKTILLALKNNDKDSLEKAALSEGGLLTDEIRKKVWPKLVGVDIYETSPRPCQKEIEAHPYYNQVVLDVNRSLKRFPPSIHEAQRLMMLDQLVFLIMRVLCRHPEMHYYQGYHDICVTFLLVLGEEMAYHVVEKLSRTHLKTFMEKNMEPTIHLLEHMYVLIGKKHPLLKEFLLKSEVGVAYCLSWLITWFGHVLNDYNYVVRLFDFFIVSHHYMPMYLTTAVVLHQESDVLKQDCDMASVHSFLSRISDDLPFEDLILDARSLFKEFTPELLSAEHPYVPRSLMKPKKKFNLFQTISKTIKRVVPASKITIPFIIAAAVLVTAVLYQTYNN